MDTLLGKGNQADADDGMAPLVKTGGFHVQRHQRHLADRHVRIEIISGEKTPQCRITDLASLTSQILGPGILI